MAAQKDPIRVHFFYVALILGLCLVGMMTNKWTKLEGFTEYLNVAATITSLVLGILAIIYSFVSTGSMSQFFGSIGQSTEQMTQISGELRNLLMHGQSIQSRAEQRTTELQGLVTELSSGISTLHTTTSEMKGTVDRIPRRLASLERRIALRGSNTQLPPEVGTWTTDEIQYFVKKSSMAGLAAVKFFLAVGATPKFASPSEIFEANYVEYVIGFLMGVDASGLINVSSPEEFDLSFSAAESAPGLIAAIDEEWSSRIRSADVHEAQAVAEYDKKIQRYFKS